MALPSLDGLLFRDVTPDRAGDVGSETIFEYHEDADGTIWARYSGGDVRLGYLVGSRNGNALDFRYVHMTTAGTTSSGHCASEIDALADGRLRLIETWQWESKSGRGSSVLEEATWSSEPRPATT